MEDRLSCLGQRPVFSDGPAPLSMGLRSGYRFSEPGTDDDHIVMIHLQLVCIRHDVRSPVFRSEQKSNVLKSVVVLLQELYGREEMQDGDPG